MVKEAKNAGEAGIRGMVALELAPRGHHHRGAKPYGLRGPVRRCFRRAPGLRELVPVPGGQGCADQHIPSPDR